MSQVKEIVIPKKQSKEYQQEQSPLQTEGCELKIEEADKKRDKQKSKIQMKKEQDIENQKRVYEKKNESQFDLDYEKYILDRELDFQERDRVVNRIHARKIITMRTKTGKKNEEQKQKVPFTVKDLVLKTHTGYNCCGYTTPHSAMNQFGLGITLYFKFLKNIAQMFFVFTLLSIPVIYFAYFVALNGKDTGDVSFQQILYNTSIGPFGDYSFQCQISEVIDMQGVIINQNNDSGLLGILNLDCLTGELEMNETLGIDIFDTKQVVNCEDIYTHGNLGDTKLQNCGNQTGVQLVKEFVVSKCKDEQICEIYQTDLKNIFSDCISEFSALSKNEIQIRLSTHCLNQTVEFIDAFGYEYSFNIKSLAFLVAFTDAIIIFIYIVVVLGLRVSDKKTRNYIYQTRVQASRFTIMISNLPKMSEVELKYKLKYHVENYVQKWVKENHPKRYDKIQKRTSAPLKIVDIKIAETSKEIGLRYNLGIQDEDKQTEMINFLKKFDPKRSILKVKQTIDIQDLNVIIDKLDAKKKIKAQSHLQKIVKLKLKCIETQKEIEKHELSEYRVKYAFLTFNTMQYREYALDALQGSSFQKFIQQFFPCCACVFDKDSFFENNYHLLAEEAPVSDNINWQNIYIPQSIKIAKRLISIIITIALLIGSFSLIVYVRNQKEEILEQYPVVNCAEERYDSIDEQVVIDDGNNDTRLGYIACYCKDYITDIVQYQADKSGHFKGKDKDLHKYCQNWLEKEIFIQALPYAAVMCIIFVNFIIQIVFRILSSFEKYNYLTQEYAKRISKIFMAMFINTGILLLLTNINFNISNKGEYDFLNYLLGGTYSDFTPDWFKNVGTIIALTITINTVSTPFVLLAFSVLRNSKRLCDRGCTKNMKKSKKTSTHDLIELYTGPEFMIDLRYSQILNTIYIGLLYSAGMPIMYFLLCLHFFILYWFDKYWVFKVCRIPRNYDEQMQNLVVRFLQFIPILHCVFAIYIYGNQQIFFELDNYQNETYQKATDNFINKWLERVFKRDYNVLLVLILAILLILYIIYNFLMGPITKLFKKCCVKAYKKGTYKNPMRDHEFREFMDNKMVEQEIMLIEYQQHEDDVTDEKYLKVIEERKKYILKQHDVLNTLDSNQELKKQKNSKTLMGLFSYDIRHNPQFKKLFKWEDKVRAQNSKIK